MTASGALALKGINYDTGTNYMPGYLSREVWNHALVQQELRAIREDLGCNAINIYGSELDRLVACGRLALEIGLQVWLQPRLIDSSPAAMLDHLAALAEAAEQLRAQSGSVTLNLGCELSVFMSGLIPGAGFLQRVTWLSRFWWLWMTLPRYRNRLNAHLRHACQAVRSRFNGQITYGSGIWENVDWSSFDLVGLNYYRERSNQSSYASDLARFHRHNKPVVITEFGCCSFEGADKLGGSGDSIVNYTGPAPVLRGVYRRDEAVQAKYIVDLLNIYREQGIHGAFVFEFTEPSHPHSHDPRHDLDMASYGLVKVYPGAGAAGAPLRWEPKQAFHALASIYHSD